MMKLIRLSALAAMTLVGVASAHAGVSTLAECYDKVIASCNQGNHAESCASSGMDQCDEVFPVPMVLDPSLSLKSPTGGAQRVQTNNLKQIGIAAH